MDLGKAEDLLVHACSCLNGNSLTTAMSKLSLNMFIYIHAWKMVCL